MHDTFTTHVGDETLIVLKCWCGMRHAVPESLRAEQMRQYDNRLEVMGVHCPMGHSHVPKGERECDRLKRRLEREVAWQDQLRAELRDAELSLSATRGVVTRIKNRIANGVCPCCSRSFGTDSKLARHIKSKHPDFASKP